jgi:hypothetical protein
MTKRVVLIVLGVLLTVLGALTAIGGGALMALFGSNDTVSSSVQQVSTPTRALVSQVAAIQDTSGIQTTVGTIRLRVTATSAGAGGPVFIGIGPAAAVDRYLSQVGHDVATDVTLTPFHLTLVRHDGTASPAPPGSQPFWVAKASGNHATVSWTVTDGSFRLVAMNANGTAPVRFGAQVALTVPHLFAIGVGVLVGGIVLLLVGVLLLVLGVRARPRPPGIGPGYLAPGQTASASGLAPPPAGSVPPERLPAPGRPRSPAPPAPAATNPAP